MIRNLKNVLKVMLHGCFNLHGYTEHWEGNYFWTKKYHVECECGYSPDGLTIDQFWGNNEN